MNELVPFELLSIEESLSGWVKCKWRTVAHDGLLLEEGDEFNITMTVEAVVAALGEVRERRTAINAATFRPGMNLAPAALTVLP